MRKVLSMATAIEKVLELRVGFVYAYRVNPAAPLREEVDIEDMNCKYVYAATPLRKN